MDEIEKRRLERFDLQLPAKIEVVTPEGEEILDLMTSDISSGCAFFHTEQPLAEGTDVKIDLVLPIEKLKEIQDEYQQVYIKITGIVLRSEPRGMAIYFNKDYSIQPRKGGDPTRH